MLILLQPGIQPLGQFDLDDDFVADLKGGEVGYFAPLAFASDGYAADVWNPGPKVHIMLGYAGDGDHPVWGLVDEGSSAGLGGRGYGTMFGQLIGGTAGQGTGIGALSTSGAVVLGPSTVRGSGKATLWTKPGLYGVTQDAWAVTSYDGAGVNDEVFGVTGTGKLGSGTVGDGDRVGYFLGESADSSFVSTPAYYAGVSSPATSEFGVLYLVGCA